MALGGVSLSLVAQVTVGETVGGVVAKVAEAFRASFLQFSSQKELSAGRQETKTFPSRSITGFRFVGSRKVLVELKYGVSTCSKATQKSRDGDAPG